MNICSIGIIDDAEEQFRASTMKDWVINGCSSRICTLLYTSSLTVRH